MMNREEYIKNLRQFGIDNEVPNISDTNAKFLRDLIKIKQVKNMLEIGSANGFSAIQFGLELEKTGGKLTTIEFSEPSYTQVIENIKAVGLEKVIFPVNGNALFLIPELKETYDFVFIDGMKRRTKDFFDLVYDKVEMGGIIIVDDVIKFKDKMNGFEEYLQENDINYNVIPIDIDDGIVMVVKEEETLKVRVEKDY
ncbi:MAG: class I SAM-dependent methyltransferase [Candidatus Gracilibacteria bacterium]|nr:class I SAM-dependent methyltransferase [Candidatus Gracilibacteria bacterium]